MKNTLKILSRLSEAYLKKRLLLVLLGIQSIVLSLIVLTYANNILSNARINGELDYYQIKFFYNMTSVVLFVIISAYVPFFLSNSLNILYEDNIIEHLLSVKVSIKDIVLAVYLRGLIYTYTLLIATFPIISISFYFGGFRIQRIIRLLILIFTYNTVLSSVCIYVSSLIKDKNVAIITGYILSIIFIVIHIVYWHTIISSDVITSTYLFSSLCLSIIFLSLARNTQIFNT